MFDLFAVVAFLFLALTAAALFAIELIAPLDTSCIHVATTSQSHDKRHPFVVDHLRRTFSVASGATAGVASGHVLILVLRRSPRDGRMFGSVRAVINHTTGSRHVDSEWFSACAWLAASVITFIVTALATFSYPTRPATAGRWLMTIVAILLSVLFLRRHLYLSGLIASIHEKPEPFLVFDAEYPDAPGRAFQAPSGP